jgi:uncharacterized membrane protein
MEIIMQRRGKMFGIGLLIICIFLGAFGQISMKTGMNQIDKIDSVSDILNPSKIILITTNTFVIFGLLLYFFGAFLWLAAMSTLDISFMYPMLSLAYLLTSFMAVLFLGEQVSVIKWAGTILVVIGCLLISGS